MIYSNIVKVSAADNGICYYCEDKREVLTNVKNAPEGGDLDFKSSNRGELLKFRIILGSLFWRIFYYLKAVSHPLIDKDKCS